MQVDVGSALIGAVISAGIFTIGYIASLSIVLNQANTKLKELRHTKKPTVVWYEFMEVSSWGYLPGAQEEEFSAANSFTKLNEYGWEFVCKDDGVYVFRRDKADPRAVRYPTLCLHTGVACKSPGKCSYNGSRQPVACALKGK